MPQDETRHKRGEQDELQRARRAPQPAQAKENKERHGSGGTTPGMMWFNPSAVPGPVTRGEPQEELERERSETEEE